MRKFLNGIAALGLLVLAAGSLQAHEYKLGDLEIDHPYSKAMIAGSEVAGGFMTITNHGKVDDRLLSVEAPFAGVAQIHQMKVENNVMTMKEIPGGLLIPAGGTVKLSPGSLHVMFTKVKKPTHEGDRVKAVLTFEKAGRIEVEFAVGPANMKADAKMQDAHKAHQK